MPRLKYDLRNITLNIDIELKTKNVMKHLYIKQYREIGHIYLLIIGTGNVPSFSMIYSDF